jgi:Ca2+-binding RTX toxin-like protein
LIGVACTVSGRVGLKSAGRKSPGFSEENVMATYSYNETQFNALVGPHVTSETLTAIDNYLIGKGIFASSSPDITMQDLSSYPSVNPTANFLAEGDSPNAIVDTGTQAKMIFVEPEGNLTLYGNNDMAVMIGDQGGAKVSLQDTGNDLVIADHGDNTIWAGSGHDTLKGGTGNDDLISDKSGAHTTMIAGSGNDTTLYAGAGTNVSMVGGAGHDTMYANGSGNDTMIAGSGPTLIYANDSTGHDHIDLFGADTLFSGTGINDVLVTGDGNQVHLSGSTDHVTIAGAGSDQVWTSSGNDTINASASTGNNDFIIGSGAASITGGTGDNTFEFGAGFGNSTIDGGTSNDNVAYFDGLNESDVTIKMHCATTTVTFGTSTVTLTNVQDLIFTNGDHKI